MLNKSQGNECITSPGQEEQNFFTMLMHSRGEISFYKGVNTGVRSPLFHNHCSVGGTSSLLSNSKTQIAELKNIKKFDSVIVLTRQAKKELQW